MFWKSAIGGFAILGHWEVWVAIVLYSAFNYAFLMIVAKIAGTDEAGNRMRLGCLFDMIGSIALEAILMGVMVVFLLPILLGGSSGAPISGIVTLLWPTIWAGLFAVVVVLTLSFIPLLGKYVAYSPGIQIFLIGAIIFRFISKYSIDQILTEANVQGSVYPGFWMFTVFLIIAGLLIFVLMFGVTMLSLPFEDTFIGELISFVFVPVVGFLGGAIPLFMYCSYVRLSIMQLIG